MNFNDHSDLEGKHAFLGASTASRWVGKPDEKLINNYIGNRAKEIGTEMHALAAELIKHRIFLKNTRKTFYLYVNDAIGYRLEPEVVLKYSNWAFGTADAIRYDEKKKVLRIHDLKTGEGEAHFLQLIYYAALFCLEYEIQPESLSDVVLRLYQFDNFKEYHPKADEIRNLMDEAVHASKILTDYVREEE